MSGPTKPYVIKQGDYLTKLAHRLGFTADEVWGLAENADLRQRRQDGDILRPGDILFVPDQPKRRNPFDKETENHFTARVPKVPVELRLAVDDEPLGDERYQVAGLDDESERRTDGDGYARFEVDVNTRQVTIDLPDRGEHCCLMVGDLDPADEPSGARMRLTQLGYYGGHREGEDQFEAHDAEQLGAALRAFQIDHGLDGSGELDPPTVKALREAHGS